MNREAFRQRLAQGALLLDGAMGTLLHARGASIDVCFDVLNIQNPALVADIHRSYIDAGADIIDVSAGQTSTDARPIYGRMFQTPFSDRIRNAVSYTHLTLPTSDLV